MDTKPHVNVDSPQYVNYSVIGSNTDGGLTIQGLDDINIVPNVFPHDVNRDFVPGYINGTGFWNNSDTFNGYDVRSISPNGSNITNATCGGNVTCNGGETDFSLPAWQVGLFGFLAVSTSVITIVGNLVVILSFFLERAIRQPTNYFIASLAVSDLLIGSLSMPFYSLYLLSGQRWLLGVNMCDLWLSVDYTVCLTSIYTVFAITIDRFCSVKIPAKYRNWRTERKVVIIITLTWVIPVLVFFTSIFAWPYIVGQRTVPDEMCYVQYLEEAIFSCILQVSYFWITLAVMCILYTGIYKVALDLQRKSEAKRSKMTSLVSMAGQTMTRIGIGMSQQAAVDARKLFIQSENDTGTSTVTSEPVLHSKLKSAENKVNNNHGASSTSFTSLKNPDHPEDRSSSPAFPSDTDPSSQSPKRSPNPECNDTSHKRKRVRHGLEKEPKSFKLQNPPKGKRSHREGRNNPKRTNGKDMEKDDIDLPDTQDNTNNHTECGATVLDVANEHTGCGVKQPVTPPPSYESLSTLAGQSSDKIEVDIVNEQSAVEGVQSPAENTGVNIPPELLSEVRYIDQESLQSLQSNDNHRTLTEAARVLTNCQKPPSPVPSADEEPDSPIWKMRGSVIIRNKNSQNSSPVKPESHNSNKNKKSSSPKTSATEPVTPAITSGIESTEPSLIFTPSPNHHTPAALQVETRGKDSRPVTQIAKNVDPKDTGKERSSRRSRGTGDGGGGSPLTSMVKTIKRSKRSRVKSKEKQQKQSRSENRARKALRTITIILGAFVLCWTPWHILSLIIGFTPREHQGIVLLKLYDISYWLCYLNSPINPLCYAFANAQFKKAFIRILKLDWHRS